MEEKVGQTLTPDSIMAGMFGEDVSKPMFINVKRYDVGIFPNRGLLQDLVNQYVQEINRLAKAKLRWDKDYVTSKELFDYVSTLTAMRCTIAREERLDAYNSLKYSITIPMFVAYCLSQIGQAKDPQFGMILVPKFMGDAKAILLPADMKRISDLLGDLEEYGLKQVKGMDKQITGSIGYMATHLAETVITENNPESEKSITSWRKDHEVYGVIASVFSAQQLHNMFNTYNVRYGYLDEYRLGLSQVVRTNFK